MARHSTKAGRRFQAWDVPALDRRLRTRVSLRPGKPGTRQLQERYGDRLVCVRHRYDEQTGRSFKTVELIVEETQWKPRESSNARKSVCLRVGRHETQVRAAVKGAGGRWNPQDRVWELWRDQAVALGLEDRIVEDERR